MASLPNLGAPALSPLTDEQLSMLISMSSSITPPPQCTMSDIQSILHKISASLAQCRLSLALACARAASDNDTPQVLLSHMSQSPRIYYQQPIIIADVIIIVPAKLAFFRPKSTLFGPHSLHFCSSDDFFVAYNPCGHIQVPVSCRGLWQRIC
jgi:hypothetical protein